MGTKAGVVTPISTGHCHLGGSSFGSGERESWRAATDVADWLRKLGLERYEATFRENDVSAVVLPSRTGKFLRISASPRLAIVASCWKRSPHCAQMDCWRTIRCKSRDRQSAAFGRRAPSGSIAERRQLTVMFCDLVSSTALSEKLDPEDLRELLRAYQACVQNTIARFGGFIARYVGDGVLVYFGWPTAQETDAERAVRAALALASTVGDTLVKGEKLKVRIGIATGLVVWADRSVPATRGSRRRSVRRPISRRGCKPRRRRTVSLSVQAPTG